MDNTKREMVLMLQTISKEDENAYSQCLRQAHEIAHRYLESIGDRHVGVKPSAIETMHQLGGPVPETGEDAHAILSLMDEVGAPATMAIMGRRFFGGVIGGSVPLPQTAHREAYCWC